MQVAFSPTYADVTEARTAMEVHTAEACRSTLLVLFRMGDASLRRAMDELPMANATRRMAYVTVDLESTNYLLFSESCTQVTAHYVVGGAASVSGDDLFEVEVDYKPGEEDAPELRPPPVPEAAAESGQDDETPDQTWLGSVEDIYESRTVLRDWRGSTVEVQMKTGDLTAGTLVSVQETNLILSNGDERQYLNMLEAEWIRRAP